jgi:peptide/nickel transport system substrate-binding protein
MGKRVSIRMLGLGLAVPLVLALAACGSGGTSGGSTTAASKHPNQLVIASATASQGWSGDNCVSDLQTNGMVYDSLLRIKTPNGDGVAPGLAKSYSYNAATHQYTFTLRSNAKFSNGKALTAADVVWSMDQWRAGKVSGSYYATIKSEAVVSTDVLTVQMTQADTFLPKLLTWCTSTIYPKDYAGMTSAAFFAKPIGAGPYKVVSSTDLTGANEVLSLAPNKYFYGWTAKNTGIKSVLVKTISDASQRALQFKSGAVDIIEGVDSATETAIGKSAVKRAKPDSLWGFLANLKKGPTSDSKVREAISLALNRKDIVEAEDDGSVAATGMLPINVPGSVPPTTPYTYNVTQAKALMKESSYPNGVTITYLYDPSDSTLNTAAQVAQSELKAIGITLKLVTTDSNTVTSRQGSGDFELSTSGASAISPTIFDPISYYQAAAYPYSGANMTVIDKEFIAGTSTTSLAAQEAAARAVQDDGVTQNAVIGMYNSAASWAVQPWVSGFGTLQYGFFYADPITVR